MSKVTITLNPSRLVKIVGIALGALALPVSVMYGLDWYSNRVLDEAEAFIKKGLPTLAAEALEPSRRRLARTERGCVVLITAYTNAYQDAKMQWAVETCVNAGFRSFEAVMAGAKVQIIHGNVLGGMELLKEAQRFRRPQSALLMMSLYRQLRRNDDLLGMAMMAPAEFPDDPELNLAALRVLAENGKWDQARKPALMLKDIFSRTPADQETRNLLVTVFEKNKDPASAQFIMQSFTRPPAQAASQGLQQAQAVPSTLMQSPSMQAPTMQSGPGPYRAGTGPQHQ